MRKITTATDLGGAPFFKKDLRDVFNLEIWAAIESLLSQFNSDVQGIVVSGCETTANGGNFDITAGIVYLNGEFMRTDAATNQAFTKYLAPYAPISDSRTFADQTTHAVIITKGAELVGSAPGAGQYLTISSLTSLDARRWKPSNRGIVAGAGITDSTPTGASATLDVNTDNTTVEINSDTLRIKDSGVTKNKVDSTVMRSDAYNPTSGDLDTFTFTNIEFVTGDAPNAPTSGSGNKFMVITIKGENNGDRQQLAIQVLGSGGSGLGTLYARNKPVLGSYGAWVAINLA